MTSLWPWIELLGFEIGFGESMLSVYRRIAVELCRPLNAVIDRALLNAGFGLLHPLNSSSEVINSTGRVTKVLLAALSSATGRSDLGRTTLIGAEGLWMAGFRHRRAWCPRCVAALAPYAPLVWGFTAYRVCVLHRLLLQDTCGNADCRGFHGPCVGRANPDACPHCGTPLSSAQHVELDIDATSRGLAELVALIQGGHQVSVASARSAIATRVARQGLASAARQLGVNVDLLADMPKVPPTPGKLGRLIGGGLTWQELVLPATTAP